MGTKIHANNCRKIATFEPSRPGFNEERRMNTIYLVLYLILGLGNSNAAPGIASGAEAAAVTGDTFKAPF